jgi:hypothetical protein
MYRKILFVLFVFSIVNVANSQYIKFGYQVGFGKYSMKSLKNINDQILESLAFDAKIVDNFPGYLYFRPSLTLQSDIYSVGLILTTQSTGSRISAKDFSGEYRFDTKVSAITPGIYGDYKLFSHKKSSICLSTLVGLSLSKLKTHEILALSGLKSVNQNILFKAQNFFFEPGINYGYSFGSFCIGLNAGYFITLGSKAFQNNNKNLHDYKNQKDVKPDWNGFRAGCSFSYTIRSKEEVKIP